MSISSKGALILLLIVAAPTAALEFDPPILGDDISDDFGPRIQVPTHGGMRASSPHPGIDFAAEIGTSFHSIEPSKITALDYNGGSGWFIEATSIANSSRTWRYQHLFRKVKISPKSKIFRVVPRSGLFRVFKTVPNPTIVIYSDIEKTNPVKAFTIRNPGDNLGDTFQAPAAGLETREVPLTNIIGAQGRERIGPVGQTGSATGPHLHLQLIENGRKLNPFLYLRHETSDFTITPVYPSSGARFSSDLLPVGVLPEPLTVNINSMQGLDLNRVEVSVIDPAGTETILGGYDYQGALSSTTYPPAATLQVVPLDAPPMRPPGKDQFRLQGARLFTSSAPAGNYKLKIKAFNIRGVEKEELVPFTIREPVLGASIQIDSGTSTASYGPSSGRFLSQVYYTATSASGIRAHQLYTFAPNSSFSQISATQTIAAGVASDLPNGDYAIVVFDNEDVATRLDFSLSTMTDSLSSYLSQIHTTTGTYERTNVFVTTSPTFDLPGYITGGNFLPIPPLVSASLSGATGEISYPPFAPSGSAIATLGVAITSVSAVAWTNCGISHAYNLRLILAGELFFDEAILHPRYTNSHLEPSSLMNDSQLSGEELILSLDGSPVASYRYTRGESQGCSGAPYNNNPQVSINSSIPMPLPKFFESKLSFKTNTASVCRTSDGTNDICFNAGVASPYVSSSDPFEAFNVTLESSLLTVAGTTRTFSVIDRDVSRPNVAVSFGSSVGIARLSVGSFSSELTSPRRLPAPSPRGVSLALTDVANTPTFNQTFKVSLPFVASELEPGQVNNLRVLKKIGGQSSILIPTISGNFASVESASTNPGDLGSYELVLVDAMPPGAISVAFSEATDEDLSFTWTASGSDGAIGQAAGYDIRFNACPGGSAIFDEMPSLAPNSEDNDFVPGVSGEEQGVQVGELNPDALYCLGVKVFDLAGNSVGPYIVSARTLPLPATIQSDDLIAGQPELEFEHQSPVPIVFSKLLPASPEWNQYKQAVADKFGIQPVSNIFNIGPSGTTFGQDAPLIVRYDPTRLSGVAADSLVLYESVEDSRIAFPLPGQIHDRQNHLIIAPVNSLFSKFAIFGATTATTGSNDVLPPRTSFVTGTAISSGSNTAFVSSASLIGFLTVDDKLVLSDGLGVGATQTFYSIDGGTFALFSSSFSISAEGAHAISFFSVDLAGNAETPIRKSMFTDLTPPVTQLAQNGSEISLDAFDPSIAGGAAGVARIRYLVDFSNPEVCNNVAEDTSAPRGTCANPWYAGPFMLSNGPHTLAFQAFDAVGNAEPLQTAYPYVGSGGTGGPSAGGMGIGKDAFDAFWTVVLDSGAIAFAHANSSGTMISSATLQDGGSDFPWSVLFGQDGRAYAIGAAEGPETQAMDLAIYKASPAGDAIESRTLFDSGYAKNDIVFDAKSPGWIVGAAQTSGPANLDEPGEITFSMALWRFDPTLGTVQLKTTYARASFDLGAGLAVDPDGSLWVAGYSLSPENPNAGAFDLALWHYAANGQTLLGGPYLRPGYLNDLDAELATKVYVTTQAVYIAATRVNSAGSTDMAFLRYDKSSGQPIVETAWRSAGGEPSYPMAILPEASGMLVVGGIGAESTQAALWRFGYDGALQGVTTADAGGATGAVFRGSELWLSVDGSTVPYRVDAEVAAAGSLVDLVPPRTSLSAGVPSSSDAQTIYVTSATPLGFTVVDDYAVPGDGLGVGATQTFYAEGGGAYTRFTSSFTLAAEGAHTVSFFSIDREGRAEAAKTRSVAVDLTAPVVSLVSSGTVFTITAVDPVVGGAASGVSRRSYLIDVDPAACVAVMPDASAPSGTCANDLYTGPFTLVPGTHTVRFRAVDRVGNESALKSQAITVTPDINETGQARFAFFFGSQGNAPGQFVGTINDVAVDPLGAVYASDFFGSKINKYDADGNFLLSWGRPGSGPGEFGRGSHGITISLDPYNNHVLATDPLYPRVQIFTSTGGFLAQIGPALNGSAYALSAPTGAAGDKAGNVYIADFVANRIFKTGPNGNFLKTWVIPSLPSTPAAPVWHVRVGGDGNVYITGGAWVLKFSPEGDLLKRFGQQGSLSIPGNFTNTRGLDFDAANNVYATDSQCRPSHCVVVFDPAGSVISSFGTSNAGPERIPASFGLAVNKNTGRIYVADTSNNRIGVWDVAVPTSDIRAPITALAPLGPTTSLSDGSLVVSPATPISFAATDAASPGLAPSGVARTEYRFDGGPLTVFTAPFTLSEVFNSLGYRLLEFRSIDKAGNVEAFQSRQVRVDSLPPRSAVYIDGIQMTSMEGAPSPLPDGVVTTASRLTFVALDSGRQGTAGIDSVSATLDGAVVAFSTSNLRPWDVENDRFFGSFDLAVPLREGPHSLSWRSIDRVGLAEQTRTLSFVATPAPADPVDIRTFRSAATIAPGVRASDIAVDALGNVYAASLGASDVKKFSPDGTYLSTFYLADKDGIGVGVSPANFVAIDVGEVRKLLAGKGKTVVMFSTEEPFVGRFAGALEGFTNAVDAVFDGQGGIYVADAGARRISVFGPGEFAPRAMIGQGLFVDGPYRIAIDRNGVIYATDRGPARVLKFSARGEFLGVLRGPLNQADGLGVDLYGNVYVADKLDNLVHVFSSTGALLTQFGGAGGARGQLLDPAGLAVHPNSGRVYVADNGNSRIQVFTLDPPPAAVDDLSAATAPETEVILRWTAPGDDVRKGRAASYDLRRATGPILSAAAFLEATPVPGLSAPQPAGSPESFLAAGLPGGTTLYFALRTTDSGGGVSTVSNNASIRLPFLARSTAAVGGKPEIVFSAAGTQPAVTLLSSMTMTGAVVLGSASAQGLAAVSAIYDLAPEGVLFEPAAVLTMRYSTRTLAELGLSETDVALYRFDSRLGWVKVAGQIIDTDRKLVTVSLSSIASIFAVLAVVRDDVPPITTIQTFGGAAFLAASEGLYVSSPTRFGFSSFDPLKLGTASGVAFTEFRINAATSGAPFQAFAAPFLLAEGSHTLDFRSRDKAGNLEVARSSAVTVDASAPVIVLRSPLGGETFVAKQSSITVRVAALDNFDASPRLEVFLVQLEDRGSPRGDRPSRVAVSSEQIILPLEIDDGLWALEAMAEDFVGNSTVAVSRTFEVIHDVRPPRTSASIGEPRFIVAGSTYVTGRTPLYLPAVDDLLVAGDGIGLGVRQAFFAVDADSFSVLTASMTISMEGSRAWRFFSVDVVGNAESTQTLTLQVDNTAPVSTITIGAPLFAGTNGTLFVSSATPFALSAADHAVQGTAAGLKDTVLSIDAAAFQVFSGTFTLSPQDGLRGISFFSRDNLLNTEIVRSATVALDNAAPLTSLAVLGGRQFPGPNATSFYASSDTRLALSAVDPTVNGVASGLALTQWQDNGGAFQAFNAAFALPEGVHALGYRSQDRVQNMEVPLSTTVLVDATPPVTTPSIGAPSFVATDGTSYIAPATPVTFTASDPVVSGVASGVNRIEVAVDGGPFTAYVAALTFAEGRRTIVYRAIDNVANVETIRTVSVQSDAAVPSSSLAIGAPSFDPGSGQPVFVAAATLLTLSAQDPVVANVASGVRQISLRRGGEPFGTYAAPFTLPLPDGLKTVDYFATDNVGNQEVTRLTMVALDASVPITSLAVLGGRQFPGPNSTSFYASADTRYALPAVDPVVGGVASGLALTQWQDNSGAFQSFAAPFGLAEGSHLLAYQSRDRVQNLEVTRNTTVLVDVKPPATTVSIGAPTFAAADGTIYIAPATPVTLSAVDPALPTGQPGSGLSRIEVAIDGGNFSAYSSAITFAEGRHTILYRAVDNVANVEVVHTLQVRSDATPPVSSLVVGEPRFQLPSALLVSTRTPFSIAAVDPISNDAASGIMNTSFRVSGTAPGTSAFSAFVAPFTMAGADVNKVIEFFSRDNVLNAEVVKSNTVLLDSTPPEIALLSPASCGAGICRVLRGKFPVLGTAQDRHFQSYTLEFALGKDADTGFALISSGTLAVSSGTLGTWDATALSGWLTMRLTATDLVANSAFVALNVFVGDPGQLMMLGNHEVFDMPEGVAVGGDGKIFVADRNNDRIAVFSSTGALLTSFGGRKEDDEDHGKHKESTTTLRLNKPSGVAVDAAGNIYVADTNRGRVLKLSADGQVLLSLGRLHHPAGVAVDATGSIYVADTGNRRVQVFSSTGALTFQFDLPPVPARLDHADDGDEKDDDDDGERAQLGKPFGIAVDAAGNIYVADPKGGRAFKFGAAGELLLTIPIPGDKPGRLGQPFGVAVSSGGDCLLVSDRRTSRILKFDFLGNSNLAFANKGKIKDDDAPAPSGTIVFKKPMGLALDAQGNLFVADRNNDRIQKLGLPTGQAPLVVPPPKPENDHIARGVVDTEDGGKVERRDRAAVDIPAGTVAADLKITVSSADVADESIRRRAADDAKLKAASPPVEYGPEGTKFKGPVTLTLPYSPELIALQNIDARDLKVRYWNRDTSQWEDLESVVDPKTRTVKAKTTHFSLYQVFSGTVSAPAIQPLAGADPTFTFRDAYAFPNPVRGSGPVTIRIQTGLADSVEVRVYDVSGRKIHSSSNFSLNSNLDDGNGKGEQYTYDHVWDVSGVGSGVYQYVITAKKAGQSDIHKTGRIGIVK